MMGAQHKVVGIGFGVATAIYMAEYLQRPGPAMVALGGSVIGCMLPDIDHDRSKIGSKRKVVTNIASRVTTTIVVVGIIVCAALIFAISYGLVNSNINPATLLTGLVGLIAFMLARAFLSKSEAVKWMTHHRGLMHTLVPPALIFMLSMSSDFSYWQGFFIGMTIGYLSHLLADSITVEGCPLLWPFTKKNIHIIFKLKTKDKSTWIAAYILAVLPCVIMYFLTGGGF